MVTKRRWLNKRAATALCVLLLGTIVQVSRSALRAQRPVQPPERKEAESAFMLQTKVVNSTLRLGSIGEMKSADGNARYVALEFIFVRRWREVRVTLDDDALARIDLTPPQLTGSMRPRERLPWQMLVPQVGERYPIRVLPSARSGIDSEFGFVSAFVPVGQNQVPEWETTAFVTALFKAPLEVAGQALTLHEFVLSGNPGMPIESLLADHRDKGQIVGEARPIEIEMVNALRRPPVLRSIQKDGKHEARYLLKFARAEWLPSPIPFVKIGSVISQEISAGDQRLHDGRIVLEATFSREFDAGRPLTLLWPELNLSMVIEKSARE